MELLLNIVVFVISVIYIIYSYVRITKRLKINNSEIRYFFKTGQPADFIQLYLLAITSFAVIYWLVRRGGQVLPFALNAKNKTGPAPRKTNAISAI